MEDTVVCVAGRHYKLTPKALKFIDQLHEITGVSKDDPKAREKITAKLIQSGRIKKALEQNNSMPPS